MKIKKRYITLIEMMIVMFLIAMIIGVVAYNYSGTLDEGKAFKTKMGIEKVEMMLSLQAASNPGLLDHMEENWKKVIAQDPLVKDPNALIKDGWGEEYQVHVEDNVIKVRSRKYEEYSKTHATMFKK